MPLPVFEIEAPSRLHFGLLSFRLPETHRQHGGVGLMLTRPGQVVRGERAERFGVSGESAERVKKFAAAWSSYHGCRLPACHLSVTRLAPQHMGLGTGTQLALSVATLLNHFDEHGAGDPRQVDPAELAASVGRAQRSSVGTHGFVCGGLIYERGKRLDEPIGELAAHITLPDPWRVLLVLPQLRAGLSGQAEKKAFGDLTPVPPETTARLVEEVEQRMLPAARRGDFQRFAESVYEYGWQAGMCFAETQGGPFADPMLERWVRAIRQRGFAGVGQSSWGPLLFVLTSSDAAAEEACAWLRRDVISPEMPVEFCISGIAERGACARDATAT
jgi:beta-RFAP synthase